MKLKRPRSRAQVTCALAALGSSALLAGGVLASPAAASAGRARVPTPAQRPAVRLANRSAHRPRVLNPAQLPAVRLLNRSGHRARLPKPAHLRAVRLKNRAAHAADAPTPFTIKLGPTKTIVGALGLDLVLDVSDASTSPGAPVITYWDKFGFSDANQYWTVYFESGDQYLIVNQNSGQCLTSDGVAGDQVYQWPCVGSPYQEWTRSSYDVSDPVAGNPGALADAWQNLASGLVLDVYGDSPWPSAAVDTWYWNGGANQIFYEEPV